MKNELNHIDELFQKGMESADLQPPSELWNQVSQSWDQALQATAQSSQATTQSPQAGAESPQGVNQSIQSSTHTFIQAGSVISKWSGITKWAVGLASTAVAGGSVYLISELSSPEKNQETIGARADKSVIHSIPSIQKLGVENEVNREQNARFESGVSHGNEYDENLNTGTQDTHRYSGVMPAEKSIQSDVEASQKGMFSKLSGAQKDVVASEGVKHSDKSGVKGVSQWTDQLQELIDVEQVENRVVVIVRGKSSMPVVLKSVGLGKEKMQGAIGNSNYLNGEFMGWEIPAEGDKLVFERKCYLELRKSLKVQMIFKILSADKQHVERELLVEREIEIQPWVVAGTEIIPNVFTPNGDGMNDEYYVNVREPKSFQILISSAERNDLGTVFQTNSSAERWNGKKGEFVCPEGKYWVSIRRVYERIDNQGNWIESTKVERILMELKRD